MLTPNSNFALPGDEPNFLPRLNLSSMAILRTEKFLIKRQNVDGWMRQIALSTRSLFPFKASGDDQSLGVLARYLTNDNRDTECSKFPEKNQLAEDSLRSDKGET